MPRASEPPHSAPESEPPPTRRYLEGRERADSDNPFERATMPPPVSEPEYVARLVSETAPSSPPEENANATLRSEPKVRVASPTVPYPAVATDPNARGGALALVSRHVGRETRPDVATPTVGGAVEEMRARFDVGDFSGALPMAEHVLKSDSTHPEARRIVDASREALRKMYVSRLGGFAKIPRVIASADQFRWLSMDHHTGFLLSLVDGRSSVEELVDVSGMPPLQALRILVDLLEHSVIQVR